MGTLITVAQVLLSLSILVVLHEWGHFYAARTFKTRVEKFYLFFNPGFSLFKKQIGETEYGIGWLPLGGYVKIAGMIDESMDKEQMAQPEQPWEFRSKPAWQRLIIMLGGVTVNFILGFLIFALALWHYGESFVPNESAKYGIHVTDSVAFDMGFQHGDKIVSIEGKPFDKFSSGDLVKAIAINDAKSVRINRDGRELDLPIAEKFISELTKYGQGQLFGPRIPFKIGMLADDGNAIKSGLQLGDRVLSVNGIPTEFYDQFLSAVEGISNREMPFEIEREGNIETLYIKFNESGKIGVGPSTDFDWFQSEKIKYGFLESFPAGFKKGINFLGVQIKAFGQMFKGKMDPKESVGGPIAIGSMFGSEWDWERFWNITAILSLILGFMNLLPIPALDGGHVVFLLWEIVTGVKPSDKFMEYTTLAGFIILMTLMVLIFGIDIMRLLR